MRVAPGAGSAGGTERLGPLPNGVVETFATPQASRDAADVPLRSPRANTSGTNASATRPRSPWLVLCSLRANNR